MTEHFGEMDRLVFTNRNNGDRIELITDYHVNSCIVQGISESNNETILFAI